MRASLFFLNLVGERDQKNTFFSSIWWRHFLALFQAGMTFLFYYPSLKYPFQFDDIANISKKFAIRFDNPLSRWWGSTRWLGEWLNRLNYDFGKFDPLYYRIFNVIIHILTGLLVFYLVYELCCCLKTKYFFNNNACIISFVTSSLFLLHPVQTQAVSYVIQARTEGLASFFIIFIIFCFVKMFTLKLKFLRNLFIFLFLAASGLSFGTKEIVVVTPFLLIIVDWFFLAQEEWCFFKTRIWFHLIYSLLFFSIFINYLNPKFAVDIFTLQTATGNNRGNVITPHAYDFITPYYFFITQFCVILHYLFIFIWPFGISVEYDWHLASSFFSPNVLFSFLFMVGILIVVCYLAYKKSLGFFPFGILWFLISLAPRTSIIPSPELMFDYKTYLASVGLLFILAATIVFCFFELYKKLGTILRGLFLWPVPELLAMIFIVPLGIFTLLQNKTWETQVSFWEYNAKMAPQKARVHNNFGVALCEAGRYDDAISEYKKAIALDNYYSDPLSNIAVAYSLKGDIDNAINSLKLAIHLCPNYAEAYNNLGSLFVKKKEYATAEQILKHAIQIRPYYGKAYYNLGRLYLEKGNEEQAWSFFKKAVEGDLDNPDGFFAFGQISLKLKKYKDAVYAFEWIVKSGFVTDQVLFSLGNSYFMIQDYDRAEKIYNDIVRNNPSDFRYIYNLAETYFMKKNYFRALELFRRVTALPNPHPPALFRVANCLEHLKKYKEAKDYLQSILSSVKIVDKSGDINKAESVKEKFIKEVKSLIAQIDLHEKVENGKGTVTLAELNKSLALAKK